MDEVVVAVDVGTRSARAGVFDRLGQMHSRAEHPIRLHEDAPGQGEHESEEIWTAVCRVVRAAVSDAGVVPDKVASIGFDATCSLVVRGAGGRRLPVSPGGDPARDTIAWFDHRAVAEAAACTETGHAALRRAGGTLSPEKQLPKMMWLKRHVPDSWAQMTGAWDLADFLAWRASGTTDRSVCTLAAKWSWIGDMGGWPADFHAALGLDDLVARAGLPADPVTVGSDLGPLSPAAAAELGLTPRTRVAAGLVDAFAGTLGMVPSGVGRDGGLAMIAGTSTCIMGLTAEPVAVAGVWGPYGGAILPGKWVFEAGQSATGALLDRIIGMFGLPADAGTHARIGACVSAGLARDGAGYGAGMHIVPDFHGNRSPFADPMATGVISGMTLDTSFEALARMYWRGCVALALGLRQILEHLRADGVAAGALYLTGGHARLAPFPQLYADATGCPVCLMTEGDAVLKGTAIAAMRAAGWGTTLEEIAAGTARPSRRLTPAVASRYDEDYAIFLELQAHRRRLDRRGAEAQAMVQTA